MCSPGPIYFQGPPTPGKPGTGQTIAFFLSFVLQLVLGFMVVFATMLAPLAYDSCDPDCVEVDRWMTILVASCVVAALCGLGSIIFWFFKTRVAWILSLVVWLSLAIWLSALLAGSA